MKQLAHIRDRRGLTQKQLGELSGLGQPTISKIERGEYNYTAETIAKLSAALNVEPAELFGLPELQTRVMEALRGISDPAQLAAALTVLESMSRPQKQ